MQTMVGCESSFICLLCSHSYSLNSSLCANFYWRCRECNSSALHITALKPVIDVQGIILTQHLQWYQNCNYIENLKPADFNSANIQAHTKIIATHILLLQVIHCSTDSVQQPHSEGDIFTLNLIRIFSDSDKDIGKLCWTVNLGITSMYKYVHSKYCGKLSLRGCCKWSWQTAT